jgi:hypothetical protein
MVTAKHLVQRGVRVANHLVACVVLEKDAIGVARRLVLLVEVPINLSLDAFVSWSKMDVELLILRVFLELSH